MKESPYVVEIRDCHIDLGSSGEKTVAFDLASLHLKPGEQTAFTGPSGCGKSTLLNLVSGLRRPDRGEILVNGTDVVRLRAGSLDAFRGRTMGFVFQGFNLLDSFTALENVQIGMRFGRSKFPEGRKAHATALLEKVGLKERLHSFPSQLSAGERQRVAVARAIANQPQLLLADEPTGALDPETAKEVFALIRSICAEQNCALMFVTHDLELAAQLPRQVDCRKLVGSVSRKEALV
jgi:ABC-type lipoprotein export system ATPase subunit